MNEFLKYVARLSVILCVLTIALLLGTAALLIFAPELLAKILCWFLTAGCIAGAVYLTYLLAGSLRHS